MFELIIGVISVFLLPLSEFSFKLKALNKLYLVRTTSPEIIGDAIKFKKMKMTSKMKTKTPDGFKGTDIEKEVENHYPIKLSMGKRLRLFFLQSTIRSCLSKTDINKKLTKMFQTGTQRLENEMSIEKILRSLRDLKILIKKKFRDEEQRFLIKYSHKNVIDVES